MIKLNIRGRHLNDQITMSLWPLLENFEVRELNVNFPINSNIYQGNLITVSFKYADLYILVQEKEKTDKKPAN